MFSEILKHKMATYPDITHIISPFSDSPMFYDKYLTLHKVHMHTGAIRQLFYDCAYVRELKFVDYPYVHTITCTNYTESTYFKIKPETFWGQKNPDHFVNVQMCHNALL